jgi:hypothetical protein
MMLELHPRSRQLSPPPIQAHHFSKKQLETQLKMKSEVVLDGFAAFQMNATISSFEFGTKGTRKRRSKLFLAQSRCGAILFPFYMKTAAFLAHQPTQTLESMRETALNWRLPGAIK